MKKSAQDEAGRDAIPFEDLVTADYLSATSFEITIRVLCNYVFLILV